jgi:DNA-binding helix-hairpin-helix protein with protein kinase domain
VQVMTSAAPCAPCARETMQNCNVRECLLITRVENVLNAVRSLVVPKSNPPVENTPAERKRLLIT